MGGVEVNWALHAGVWLVVCLIIGTCVLMATLPVCIANYPLRPPILSRCQINSNVPSIKSLWYLMVAWKIMKLSTGTTLLLLLCQQITEETTQGQLYFYFCCSRLQKKLSTGTILLLLLC